MRSRTVRRKICLALVVIIFVFTFIQSRAMAAYNPWAGAFDNPFAASAMSGSYMQAQAAQDYATPLITLFMIGNAISKGRLSPYNYSYATPMYSLLSSFLYAVWH